MSFKPVCASRHAWRAKPAQTNETPRPKQLAALGKYRSKGQQKVTVEHVQVHSGGQAIVGNVNAGSRAIGSRAANASQQIEGRDDES